MHGSVQGSERGDASDQQDEHSKAGDEKQQQKKKSSRDSKPIAAAGRAVTATADGADIGI